MLFGSSSLWPPWVFWYVAANKKCTDEGKKEVTERKFYLFEYQNLKYALDKNLEISILVLGDKAEAVRNTNNTDIL